MTNPYLKIAKNLTFEQEIKKSRFICSLARVSSEEEAQSFIQQIQNQNKKANHNCYAYTIGDHFEIKRESDNGEPSGTAGIPILNTIEKENLHDVVAVVTRYFGGIKLGAGGLIRAYGGTSSAAIREVGFVERILQKQLIITASYSNHEKLKYYLTLNNILLVSEEFGADVTITIAVANDKIGTTIADLTNQFNNSLDIIEGDEQYSEIPFEKNP